MYRLYEQHSNGIRSLLAEFETLNDMENCAHNAKKQRPECNYVGFAPNQHYACYGWWN